MNPLAIFLSAVLAVFFLGLSASPQAQTLNCNSSYGVSASAPGSAGQACFDKAQQFIDAFNTGGLKGLAPTYTGNQPISVVGRFNDVDITSGYAVLNSPILTFSIPQLGVNQSFTGSGAGISAQRDDAARQLGDYLKKNGILDQIWRYQAQNSASSPISGVGGLIPSTVASDFDANFNQTGSQIAAQPGGVNNNAVGIGLNYSSFSVSNRPNISSFTLPLSYSIKNDIDPRRQLNISMPITVVSVGDAKTYHGGLGAAYRIPMSDRWTITPGARYSATVSKDQASIAGLFSGSVASTYVFEQDAFDITVGNMIGYYATQKFTAGDYSFNPGIKNTVLRNGVMLTQPVMALGQAMSVEYSIIDTRYLGTDVFMDNTQEVGVTLGTSKRATSARSYLRAGMSYTHGPSISGFTLKLGYWF